MATNSFTSNGTEINWDERLTLQRFQDLQGRMAALHKDLADELASDISQNPHLADALTRQLREMLDNIAKKQRQAPTPSDSGLGSLIGLGEKVLERFTQVPLPSDVEPYDEKVTSQRIEALADLYFIYQHEKIGVFKVIHKLQELFQDGSIHLSDGIGATRLYQFDRREVLRYTIQDRLAGYRRAFGYGNIRLPVNAHPNCDFQNLFTSFIRQVALYWRDKRISEVVRDRAYDPSFASIAMVRRAGLDLRNNMKHSSYGHLSVLKLETMMLLDDAFHILEADDIRRQFGAENSWDVIEEVLTRYFNETLVTSPRQCMANAGRQIITWLGYDHINQPDRTQFETLLNPIAEQAEEWLTSAESLGIVKPLPPNNMFWQRPMVAHRRPTVARAQPRTRYLPNRNVYQRAAELEDESFQEFEEEF